MPVHKVAQLPHHLAFVQDRNPGDPAATSGDVAPTVSRRPLTMNDSPARPSGGKRNAGLDEAVARPSASRPTAVRATSARATTARATAARSAGRPPETPRHELKSARDIADELRGAPSGPNTSRRPRLTSAPVVAAIVFGMLALIASASMLQTLERFASAASMSTIVLVAVPALFAALFALLFFLGTVRGGWPAALGRGVAVALATWLGFAVLAGSIWCGPGYAASCFGSMLLVSGVVGGGPMLLGALIGGAVMAWLLRSNTR